MSASGVRVGRGMIGLVRERGAESRAERAAFARWRSVGIGLLRIAFGVVWAIDAWFKWQPAFVDNFTDYLAGARQDQPAWIQSWMWRERCQDSGLISSPARGPDRGMMLVDTFDPNGTP